jgi:nucleoside-diphosphate-sugar epimerase
MDCSEIKNQLGWEPEKDNIETLTNMIEWYKKEKL